MSLVRRHSNFVPILFAALLFGGTACSRPNLPHEPPADRAPATAAFGSTQIFRIGKSITFEDGLRITLMTINDSRCPAKVECIWAGELTPELTARGGELGENEQKITLGTTTAKQRALDGYALELTDASTTTATLTVSKTGDAGNAP